MKTITFHINNEAYELNIGTDEDGLLEKGLKRFLTTEKNLSTVELLLAYLRITQEFVNIEENILIELEKLPELDSSSY